MNYPAGSTMRVSLTLFACAILLGSTGCYFPLPSKVSHGHRYSKDALAFLDSPETTRAEVIASLGPPLFEHESRILVYEWRETPRAYLSLGRKGNGNLKDNIVEDYPEQFGLFIALDAKGLVEAHEIKDVGETTLQQACAEWQKHRGKKQ